MRRQWTRPRGVEMADNHGVAAAPVDPANLPELARKIVFDHVKANLEKTDLHVQFNQEDVYVVTFSFVLGCWKALVSTTLPNGQYYEVTCNKPKSQVYIDTYVKVDNTAIDVV